MNEICASKEANKQFLTELNAYGKSNGLKPMESIGAVVLTAEEWTPQNNLVTAAQKINRKNISNGFRKVSLPLLFI